MKNRKGYKRFHFDDGTTADVEISDKESVMEKHPDPRFSNTDMLIWLDKCLDWERHQRGLAELAQSKGSSAANAKRTQAAKDYWRPYQEQYHQLIAAGMKPGEARKEIDYQIRDDKSWPPDYLKTKSTEPSQKVLEKWLK